MIRIFVDSCVFNKFYEHSFVLSQVLPDTSFQLFVSREVVDFELEALFLSSEDRKRELIAYIKEQIRGAPIIGDSFFGFACEDVEARSRVVGFDQGRFMTPNEERAQQKYYSNIYRNKLRPSDLHPHEADLSLAIRSFDQALILTAERKSKAGLLQKAYADGGRIIFWEDYSPALEDFSDFVVRAHNHFQK